jgi:adsorption protein B
MGAHGWADPCLLAPALWVLVSGLDDFFIELVFAYMWVTGKLGCGVPMRADLAAVPRKRIAVFIPLWKEHAVVGRMLEYNVTARQYAECEFFAGAYPNDPLTVAAIETAARRFPSVHLAMCPHDGPTSKADCLNWIYQRLILREQESGTSFDLVVMHDAEDLMHPDELALVNYYARDYDMVQVPVLPLPTPGRDWTHGVYCDEFAEYQTKDIPVRQFLGGFVASNGVGTGFTRAVLEQLAAGNSGRIFDPASLTEDYETGFRIHALSRPQVFVPLHRSPRGMVATREYFPRDFRSAVKQRTRWVMGIALQSWERHGWQAPKGQLYWLWRDRKGLVGNLVTPAINTAFVWGAWQWTSGSWNGSMWHSPLLAWLFPASLAFSALQVLVRAACAGRIYGWRFALGVPLRTLWANGLNSTATVLALWRYAGARLRREPLAWLKTDHVYPNREALTVRGLALQEDVVQPAVDFGD